MLSHCLYLANSPETQLFCNFIRNQGSCCEFYWSLWNPGKNRASKPCLACRSFFNISLSERQNEQLWQYVMYCHFYCTFRGRGFLRGHADKWLANSFLADCVSLLRHQSSTVNYHGFATRRIQYIAVNIFNQRRNYCHYCIKINSFSQLLAGMTSSIIKKTHENFAWF